MLRRRKKRRNTERGGEVVRLGGRGKGGVRRERERG